MKLRSIPEILRNRWNILVYIWFGLMVGVLIYALLQPSLYETQATIIIRPMQSMSLDKDFVRALDTLGRGGEIGSTFVEIINSGQMKQTIINNLDLPPEMLVGLNVYSNAISGTNILEVKVQGNDPKLVKDFADELTLETKARIGDIYGVFEIEPLDDFVQPRQPVRSNTGDHFNRICSRSVHEYWYSSAWRFCDYFGHLYIGIWILNQCFKPMSILTTG